MAWRFTGLKAEANGVGLASLNVTLNNSAPGTLIVVCCSYWRPGGPSATVTVSDGINGNYSQVSGSPKILNDQGTILAYLPNNLGGNLTVNINPSGGTDSYDMWASVSEFSGGWQSADVAGEATNNSGTSTTGTASAITPKVPGALLIAALGYDTSATITENGAGEGYTLLDEIESPAGVQPGSAVFKILADMVSQAHTWALGASADWTTLHALFLPATEPGKGVYPVLLEEGHQPSGFPSEVLSSKAWW